jgi:integrase
MPAGIVITDRWKNRAPEHRTGTRWRVRVRDPHHRVYESRSFADYKEGERWGRSRRIAFQASQDTAVVASFSAWGALWVERLRLRQKTERHIRQTEVAIARLVEAGADDMRHPGFESVVERTIARLVVKRKGGVMPAKGSEAAALRRAKPEDDRRGASTATKNFHVTIAKAVCRYAMRKRAIPYDPLSCLEAFGGPTELRRIFSVSELKRLVHPQRETDEWFLFAAILIYTGARSSEVRGMRWDMVRWEANLIELPAATLGNKLKTARQIPIQEELRLILFPRAQVGKAPLIGAKLAELPPGSVSRGFQDYLKRCGIESGGRGPHCARHTFCAVMTAMDVNSFVTMSIVGHSEPCTAKHYASRALEVRPQVCHWPRGDFHLRRVAPKELAGGAGSELRPSPWDVMATFREGLQPSASPASPRAEAGGS